MMLGQMFHAQVDEVDRSQARTLIPVPVDFILPVQVVRDVGTFWVTLIFIRPDVNGQRATDAGTLLHCMKCVINFTKIDVVMQEAGTHVNDKIIWFKVTEWEMHIKAV